MSVQRKNKTSVKKRLTICFLLIVLCFTIGSIYRNQSNSIVSPKTVNGFFFDTFVTITIYDDCSDSVLQECLKICESYDSLLSKDNPDSDLYRINHATGNPVTVSEETIYLIKTAWEYANQTNGQIDPTIESVNVLWDFHQPESPHLPKDSDIQSALSNVNYQNIEFTENTVRLTNPDTMIGLGFLAKGYIADQLRDYLISEGIQNAIVNLGGNVLVMGRKAPDEAFRIAIEKPFSPGTPLISFETADGSLVTSGIYHRYFIYEERIYHHILNTSTGYPVENELYSVSILGPESTVCDALSTTCFVLGPKQGMELIEATEGYEALFLFNDYSIQCSGGFPAYTILE